MEHAGGQQPGMHGSPVQQDSGSLQYGLQGMNNINSINILQNFIAANQAQHLQDNFDRRAPGGAPWQQN